MAQTIRAQATNLANLANNTAGDISPTDLRDAWISLQVYGGMAVQDAAPLTQAISVAGTPEKTTFWNVDLPSNGVTSDSTTNNRITCGGGGGDGAGDYLVSFDISFATSTGGAAIYEARLHINGTANGDGCHRTIGSTAIGTTVFSTIVTLSDGDYLEIFQELSSGTPNIEIHDAHFTARRLG